MSDIYCGIGKVPKGKKRGTGKQCLKAKQVRFYGVEALKPELLEPKPKGKKAIDTLSEVELNNLHTAEALKLRGLQDKAKLLIRTFNNVKLQRDLAIEHNKPRTENKFNKEIAVLMERRDKLVKKLEAQKKVVSNIEKQQKNIGKKPKAKKKPVTKKKSITKKKPIAKRKPVVNKKLSEIDKYVVDHLYYTDNLIDISKQIDALEKKYEKAKRKDQLKIGFDLDRLFQKRDEIMDILRNIEYEINLL